MEHLYFVKLIAASSQEEAAFTIKDYIINKEAEKSYYVNNGEGELIIGKDRIKSLSINDMSDIGFVYFYTWCFKEDIEVMKKLMYERALHNVEENAKIANKMVTTIE